MAYALFALGVGYAENKDQDVNTVDPQYNPPNTFSMQDLRLEKATNGKLPVMHVISTEQKKKFFENYDDCQDTRLQIEKEKKEKGTPTTKLDLSKCPQYEWTVPFTTVEASEKVARQLRRDWQRFEERYWWRVHVQLNQLTEVPLRCWFNFPGSMTTHTPKAFVHNLQGFVPDYLKDKMDFTDFKREFWLDNSYYSLVPVVNNSDFCDGMPWDLIPMYLPGTCWDQSLVGYTRLCLQGGDGEGEPRPLLFDRGRAERRVQDAIKHAHSKYIPQYVADTTKTLSPGITDIKFQPLWWNSYLYGKGAVIAPVMNTEVDLKQFWDLPQYARDHLENGDANKPLTELYYSSSQSQALQILTLPGTKNVLESPPGSWKLEEFKRRLEPRMPSLYERFGYATFFQAWQTWDTLTLPQELKDRPARRIVFWATGTIEHTHWGTCYGWPIPIPFPCPVTDVYTVPIPIPIAPYFMPYTGPRTQHGWVSVPEGYPIPRVTGTPVFDYWGIFK
ncbi:hypothetical protein [Deinococcus cellulosilyticus]|uniref:Uncharacterized protein n=1 Tax=Deinococcus cellulosilyticus (strain DSM 18568 / NBRC 106333 / KACC 11606 / 5516J-15) TaxID=1223518 RepID=A0A511NAS0_DEIC1|nr:hypothetical protein [Deinococcus cellulosilyticus]GEM49910.1 hypothetical protein DC3_55450 [Deinococcus cellulosilyticus NBRC 106333 = KACC 11606]